MNFEGKENHYSKSKTIDHTINPTNNESKRETFLPNAYIMKDANILTIYNAYISK